jgi:carboxyvinyl-carboxyphosphonate phosphorylmutase
MVTERRARFREIFKGSECIHPASVFDPVSARIAASLGYETAMLAGSVASATVLGAPDVVVLTATELADLCRRIARAADIPLIVDADHGFGNALNVMRTVEELEAAGVAALTLEDTALPEAFGAGGAPLTGIDEMVARLRAALAARKDPLLSIVGRTGAIRHEGLAGAIRRVIAYESAGVDAIFLAGARSREEITEIRRAIRLPLILGITPAGIVDREWLSSNGVCIAFRGHAPFQAAMYAVYATLSQLRDGAVTDALPGVVDGQRILEEALPMKTYDEWRRDFLGKT